MQLRVATRWHMHGSGLIHSCSTPSSRADQSSHPQVLSKILKLLEEHENHSDTKTKTSDHCTVLLILLSNLVSRSLVVSCARHIVVGLLLVRLVPIGYLGAGYFYFGEQWTNLMPATLGGSTTAATFIQTTNCQPATPPYKPNSLKTMLVKCQSSLKSCLLCF